MSKFGEDMAPLEVADIVQNIAGAYRAACVARRSMIEAGLGSQARELGIISVAETLKDAMCALTVSVDITPSGGSITKMPDHSHGGICVVGARSVAGVGKGFRSRQMGRDEAEKRASQLRADGLAEVWIEEYSAPRPAPSPTLA